MFGKQVPVEFALCLAMLAGQGAHGDVKDGREAVASRFPVVSGIGCGLAITDAGPRIAKVGPGSVAERSGRVKEGDIVLSIREGERRIGLKGKPLGEVVSLIRGPVGTTVTLEISPKDGGSSYLVQLKREAVAITGPFGQSTYDELIGKPAPAARFSSLEKPSPVKLSDYAGRIVVVDFWASWCGTCFAPVDKMQELSRAHPEWKGRVALLTATIDTDLVAASKVVKDRKWKDTTQLSIAQDALEAMKIATVPTVIILSTDGKIVAVGDPHSISIEQEVAKLLVPPATDSRDK